MKLRINHQAIGKIASILLAAALLSSCSSAVKTAVAPSVTPAVPVGESSFADGRGVTLGFKLLDALEVSAGEGVENNILGTSGIIECLAAVKNGASGATDEGLAEALGMQDMLPKQINDIALRLRQATQKFKQTPSSTAWTMIVGDGQAVKESYLSDCEQSLQLNVQFQQLNADTGNQFLSEWADESTGGRIKKVGFKIPKAAAPFFVDLLEANPDWQVALDTGKSRPLAFHYENGDDKAVPTMICMQTCGVYAGAEGSMAILPTAGDETRLVVMVPPANLALSDFIPVAAQHYDDWLGKAEWKSQRVLLPRFELKYEGSVMSVLRSAGVSALLAKGANFSSMGGGLYFSDILHKCELTVDESGVDSPDPTVSYHEGIKDSIPTLAVNRPFLFALMKTDTGQVLMMGYLRDPLTATPAP